MKRRPIADLPILRQRQLGSWYPSGSRFPGDCRREGVRVGSGVLKVRGAFWDKLGGSINPSAHPASGEE